MIMEIIKILENDIELQSLLGGAANDKHIEALSTTRAKGDVIVYNFTPILETKIKEVCKLEIRIISNTIQKTLNIEDRVKELLLTNADEALSSDILSIELNGGGTLEFPEIPTIHQILIFNIIRRK